MTTATAIRAVIFDFNGVLVDDESVHFDLFREVLAQEGVLISERDYHERYLGYDDRGCFEAALSDAGQAADRSRLDTLIARKAKRYVEVAEQGLRFFPHAAETLATLAARWPLAINSGALRPEIEYALRRLNCREYVAAIVSAEDAVNCKPHPEGYRLALQALRDHMKRTGDGDVEPLDACQCLVIEDSLAGVISAKDAGMFVVGVTNTYASDQLRQAGAVDVIDSLAALTPDWISQRFEPVGGPV